MNLIYTLIAKVLARPAVAAWVIKRAHRTPYSHLSSADGTDVYMERYWLFNPYQSEHGEHIKRNRLMRHLPSARLHIIRRPDRDRHLHDHPWDARTFVLRGWYQEERLNDNLDWPHRERPEYFDSFRRSAGDTASLKYGEYHRITQVAPDGVYTLFVTFRYVGTWGFLVDGAKIPWRDYIATHG